MTLLIMAAGMGSRFGGIKQIEPVGEHNELIIDYSIYDAMKAGFDKVVFVIRREIEEDFRKSIFDRIKSKVNALYVFQEINDLPSGFSVPKGRKKPWGTAHAVMAARGVIHEPFCVINADDFYGSKAFEQAAGFLKNLSADDKNKQLTVCFELVKTLSDQGAVSRGVVDTDADGKIVAINERTKVEMRDGVLGYIDGENFNKIDKNAYASVNFLGFTPDIMDTLMDKFVDFMKINKASEKAEFLIPVIMSDLYKEGTSTLEMVTSDEQWLGFTYPEDKIIVKTEIEKLNRAGKYPTPLW